MWHSLGESLAAGAVALLASAALTVLLRWRLRLLLDDRPISTTRRLAERAYYAHWGACLLASCLFIPLIALVAVDVASLGQAALIAYGVSLLVGGYAVFVRTRIVRVRTIELELERLPRELDGYRIAQLSDLHIGSMFPATAAKAFVVATNRLAPDLVALTGDYLTSGSRFHEDVARLLTTFEAKDGTFAVWGNHDNYGDREPLRTLLQRGGVRLLENESTTVERDGAQLTLVGVDDIYSRRSDVEASFRTVASGSAIVALVHDPKLFPAVADRGADLVLTGHTHWGQVALPLLASHVNLAKRFFRFSGGLYRQGASTLYVHPGVGETGPPLRFGVPPEVTLFVLRSAGTSTRGTSARQAPSVTVA